MKTNTVIIGSGIAGMTAAIYLKRANIDFIIIEKGAPGGQILRTSTIENYPGFNKIDGPEFAMNVYKQLNELNVNYIFDDVKEISNNNEKILIKTQNSEIVCENIIIATGRNPRKIGLDNEDKYIGKGISYCALCDGNLYKDKNVAIIGGGNSAFEEALYLSKICKKVTLISRNTVFKADEIIVDRVKETNNIDIKAGVNVSKIIGNDKVEQIELTSLEKLDIDALFLYIGQEPNTEMLKNLEITDESGYIIVNEFMETKAKNIYACGDVILKNTYQIITAASEGAVAANQIIKKES